MLGWGRGGAEAPPGKAPPSPHWPIHRPPTARPPPAHRPPTARPPPAHRPPTARPPPAHRSPTAHPATGHGSSLPPPRPQRLSLRLPPQPDRSPTPPTPGRAEAGPARVNRSGLTRAQKGITKAGGPPAHHRPTGSPAHRFNAPLFQRPRSIRVFNPGGQTGWSYRVVNPGVPTGWSNNRVVNPGGRTGWSNRVKPLDKTGPGLGRGGPRGSRSSLWRAGPAPRAGEETSPLP